VSTCSEQLDLPKGEGFRTTSSLDERQRNRCECYVYLDTASKMKVTGALFARSVWKGEEHLNHDTEYC